ncbi:3-oxoacyl-ACP synthase III family protein [Streptomyces sp. NPDC058701]|uniref:3-oxoacyl-ACP synthase III family protein n=1 Tax=Streptomyces sp. NPDC058701 TaxID=3346608 RepID=UPI0036684F22
MASEFRLDYGRSLTAGPSQLVAAWVEDDALSDVELVAVRQGVAEVICDAGLFSMNVADYCPRVPSLFPVRTPNDRVSSSNHRPNGNPRHEGSMLYERIARMKHLNVGIYGVGTYLPDQVRSNDFWSEPARRSWVERRRRQAGLTAVLKAGPKNAEAGPGEQIIISELERSKDDIFQGVDERRVMAEEMVSSDMEVSAAEQALACSGIRAQDVDFILTHSLVPDRLGSPNASAVQRQLGMRQDTLAMATEGACNSFQQQLLLAQAMIQTGSFRHGLIIQSAAPSRLLHMEDQISVTLGDGAAAAVLGPVSAERGILGAAHFCDGSVSPTAVCDPIDSPWYSARRNVFHVVDSKQGRKMLLSVADISNRAINEALRKAGLTAPDIDFYASHQGAKWMRRITQEHAGLASARFVDTFSRTGSLFSANIPFQLAEGCRMGMINDGDAVAMFSGGTGITWAATTLRWGH